MVQFRLEIENLSVSVKAENAWYPILKDVSLVIKTGETVALTGPSGSGKTTLIQLISGVLPSHNYHISADKMRYGSDDMVYDLQIHGLGTSQLAGKSVTLVYQDPDAAMNPVLKVKDILDELCKTEEDRTNMNQLLVELGLIPHEILSKYPFQLSGGQKQRILLALALFPEPELLIADEPTSALDRHHQNDFLDIIKRYKDRHPSLSILFITHDLGIADTIADRVISLKDGRVEVLASQSVIPNKLSPNTKEAKPRFDQISVAPFQLRVEGLTAGYTAKAMVVSHVNLSLKSGEFIGIAGPSGSGKSTLLRALLGLMPLHEGKVVFNDTPLSSQRRRILGQLIYQDPDRSFNPVMTIGVALKEILNYHATAKSSHIDHYLQALQLPSDTLVRLPHTFSGGQKQRIAILRALLVNPPILLCDEPFSSLDIQLQHELMNLLQGLCKQSGMGIIMVAHNLPLLAKYCDRILVINKGEVYWEGSPSALYESDDSWLKTLVGN
jgi:peptide/nickel transport system ATP-binding protein